MVAIEHRQKPTLSTTKVVETSTPATTTTAVTTTAATTNTAAISHVNQEDVQQQQPTSLALHQNQQKTAKQSSTASTTTTTTTKTKLILQNHNKMSKNELESAELSRRHQEAAAAAIAKSAVSQRGVDIKISNKSNADAATQELTKKVLKLDLTSQDLDEYSIKSPRSPISARLPHQTSLTSSVDVEDRKTLREALYQGIFHRHRRTIFAVGSFLRMLRSRNSQYNTIRNPSSEGEDTEEVR